MVQRTENDNRFGLKTEAKRRTKRKRFKWGGRRGFRKGNRIILVKMSLHLCGKFPGRNNLAPREFRIYFELAACGKLFDEFYHSWILEFHTLRYSHFNDVPQ